MICITFDTDWISNEHLEQLNPIDMIPGKATFYCTQPYEYLEKRIEDVEIAIHPRLDWGADWLDEITKLKAALPYSSDGIRPHSCAYSQLLGVHLRNAGYTYISQVTLPNLANPKPYRHPWGIWEAPIFYMDNMDFTLAENWKNSKHTPFQRKIIDTAVHGDGVYVFDFHPIHLMLNTPDRAYYQENRNKLGQAGPIAYSGYGTRSFFEELIGEMKKYDVLSYTVDDTVKLFEGVDVE
ncbi:hypothetical protein GTO91_07280 [Heliobacterium undosum]|uniref:Polysaccharide deacetylase n=1 Tax=Heliomicrobium undosum TaxID=121734 RepID=A0A845KZK1_9FIRM|nr:hypothetical protein [Heliomicrobium undosum]MZP29507.1 hypothetical protein [Heliomicrobium undosum]